MVVITLYRGNIHRVSDAERRWLMPTPKISLKDFRILLHRRSRAIARLRLPTAASNPNLIVKQEPDDGVSDNDRLPPPPSDPPNITTTTNPEEGEEGPSKEGGVSEEKANVRKGSDGGDFCEKSVYESQDVKREVLLSASNRADEHGNSQEEKPPEALENPNETSNKIEDGINGKEKRENEVEGKLQTLNAKKHDLVQALKQILNAEEELKRQISMQGMGIHSSVSLQVDTADDSELTTRIASPRLGSEGNLVLHSPWVSLAAGSPHFAATGHEGHPANLPKVNVSVSGTSYIASSPSSAASGGTSAFRDGRLLSPWN